MNLSVRHYAVLSLIGMLCFQGNTKSECQEIIVNEKLGEMHDFVGVNYSAKRKMRVSRYSEHGADIVV